MKTRRLAVLLLSLLLVVAACASAYALDGEKVFRLNQKQIAVHIPNEPGSLQKITQIIADHNINLNGITIRHGNEALFIVEDATATSEILKEAGYSTVSIEDVLSIEIKDVPGGANSILKVFADAGVNIEHLYMFEQKGKELYFIFNFKDVDKAVSVLKDAGAQIM